MRPNELGQQTVGESFYQLVRRHDEQLYAMTRAALLEDRLSGQVLMESIDEAWAGFPEALHRRESLSPWLVKLTGSHVLEWARGQDAATPAPIELRFTREGARLGAGPGGAEWLLPSVASVVAGLPASHRAVLALSDLGDLSCGDIAQAAGVSVAAVRHRLHEARLCVASAIGPGPALAA